MHTSRVHRLPVAVLITTLFAPMAIGIPVILTPAVVGWQAPPWWVISQLFFLFGFLSVGSMQFTPCWDLLRYSDDSILADIAIHDTISFVSMSISWLLVGIMLYAVTLTFSRGKFRFSYAFAVTTAILFVQIALPYLLLLEFELWLLTATIPLPIPALTSVVGLLKKHHHNDSQ